MCVLNSQLFKTSVSLLIQLSEKIAFSETIHARSAIMLFCCQSKTVSTVAILLSETVSIGSAILLSVRNSTGSAILLSQTVSTGSAILLSVKNSQHWLSHPAVSQKQLALGQPSCCPASVKQSVQGQQLSCFVVSDKQCARSAAACQLFCFQ